MFSNLNVHFNKYLLFYLLDYICSKSKEPINDIK